MKTRRNRKHLKGMNKHLRGIETLENRLMLAGDIEFRTFDGSGNNQDNDDWGAAHTQLLRLTTVEYGPDSAPEIVRDEDGNITDVVFPVLAPRLDSAGTQIDPRVISNFLFDQDASLLNDRGLTSFTFQWGQFLDHDMDLTEDFAPVGAAFPEDEFIPIRINRGDELFLEGEEVFIPVLRSRFEVDDEGVAQQINQITSYIDASNVYGSDDEKADGLRAHFGGFLLTSDGVSNLGDGSGNFLPFNTIDLENASPPTTGTGVSIHPEDLFIAGDVRSNEQPGLTTLHTLFVLEHNYQARRIAEQLDLSGDDLADPDVDEYVYQLARAITNAEVQSITYNEFIPALIGPDQLESYSGYQDNVNASIANIFSASLYRVGHTMLPDELLLLDTRGEPVPDADVLGASVRNGEVALGEAFFNPELITQFGIEPYLKGLAEQQIQEIDNLIVDGVRNLLFDPPAAIDLGATNLQRGRDHGLADYNQTRADFDLPRVTSFSQISSNPEVVAALEDAYDAANDGFNGYSAIDNIDVFAGAISENHIAGGSVGELLQVVLVDQFTRLRDGDRFFYENVFSGSLLREIQNTRLSHIIRRNTDLDGVDDVQDEVFRSKDVFTFRAEEGRGSANVTLRVRGGELQVVKGRSNRVLATQDLADTNTVVIYGTSKNDKIRIDASVAAAFSGSVELHGGSGSSDTLIVNGTSLADDVVVAPTEITINDLSLYFGNFERVKVDTAGGDDFVSVVGSLDLNLKLAGGLGNDVLVGGPGREVLVGGRGRDILVGGGGTDYLFGNFGEDILVGNTARADLDSARDIWTGALSYAERIVRLNELLSSEEDGARDYFFGGLGLDLLLVDPHDVIFDRWFREVVT